MLPVCGLQVSEWVYAAYEQLGRAAVFVTQARIGETRAAHDEPLSLERHWQNIEDPVMSNETKPSRPRLIDLDVGRERNF